ncbi:MAG: hypothetical protein ACE5E5_03835 [Phycisphaerae bacterium]
MVTKFSARKHSAGGSKTGSAAVPRGYKNVKQTFENKINSFKTLCTQTCGTAKYQRPSTTVLNSFAKWINKGAVVQTVTCAQLSKWAQVNNKTFNTRNPTTAACKSILTAKFGKAPIKACARTKTGAFMVATSPTVKGKTFKFPKC